MELIDKEAVLEEIKRVLNSYDPNQITSGRYALIKLRNFIDALEVKDPYEQCVQYPSIEDGIKAHAETYSFNIESQLFNQLMKEQQELWRKEIEQACISGGNAGVELARDIRYKENVEVKDADCEMEIGIYTTKELLKKRNHSTGVFHLTQTDINSIAKHFFELGLKAKGE